MDFILNNPTLHEAVRKLTLHQWSGMNQELNNFQKINKIRKVNARAMIATLDDNPIAWALLSKEASTFRFGNGTEYNAGYGMLFEVFVQEQYRRKGIGSELLKQTKKIAPGQRICVAPHDYPSESFFNNNRNQHNYNLKAL